MGTNDRDEVRDFLTTRRAKVRPEQVELPGGQNHRVPGLRRGEVAVLANVSIEYYSKLEREHLMDLARALYSDLYETQQHPVNLARFAFLNRGRSELFYPNWDLAADQCVAILRAEAGRDPYNKELQDRVGELSTRSPEFRAKWGAHDVRRHATGTKHFHHPLVGDLDLLFEGAELMADPGLSLLLYSAEPGSPTADALRMLASWAATQRQEDTTAAAEFSAMTSDP